MRQPLSVVLAAGAVLAGGALGISAALLVIVGGVIGIVAYTAREAAVAAPQGAR